MQALVIELPSFGDSEQFPAQTIVVLGHRITTYLPPTPVQTSGVNTVQYQNRRYIHSLFSKPNIHITTTTSADLSTYNDLIRYLIPECAVTYTLETTATYYFTAFYHHLSSQRQSVVVLACIGDRDRVLYLLYLNRHNAFTLHANLAYISYATFNVTVCEILPRGAIISDLDYEGFVQYTGLRAVSGLRPADSAQRPHTSTIYPTANSQPQSQVEQHSLEPVYRFALSLGHDLEAEPVEPVEEVPTFGLARIPLVSNTFDQEALYIDITQFVVDNYIVYTVDQAVDSENES